MNITLEVVNGLGLPPGTLLRKEFDSRGGTIGRAPDCDWVLASEYVSRRHATISLQGETFYIETHSVNGVALNSPQTLIPQNERRTLKDGDRLFIDEIEIVVAVGHPAVGSELAQLQLIPDDYDPLGTLDAAKRAAAAKPLGENISGSGSSNSSVPQRPPPEAPPPTSAPVKPMGSAISKKKIARNRAPRVNIEYEVEALQADTRSPIDLATTYGTPREARQELPDRGCVYPVWFATNRRTNLFKAGFSSNRSNKVSLGRVDVFVPESHRFSETGSPFWKRLLRFDVRDDHLRIQTLINRSRQQFYSEIAQATKIAKDTEGQSSALLFVHGFNVTFEEAAIRAAQIGFDLKVQGATAFFSWPSCGKVTKYAADEASIEASEPYITDFLIDFAANCGADRIHLMAHSMGNRGLLRGLQRIAARAEEASKLKFEQIFLAAPDVDRDVFVQLASLFTRHCTRATLYASGHDLPVFLSKMFHGAPRAGYVPPYTIVHGIDTVEVPNFNVDLLGHSYFAQAEALLHDMFDLMQRDTVPARRQRIEARSVDGETLWCLRR